jgi:hypothetical protein
MSRPTRDTPAGRAYLDLQNRARAEARRTQELLVLYVVERWLARLSASPYADQFVLKGGMLLAAFDARRPTADADTFARNFRTTKPPWWPVLWRSRIRWHLKTVSTFGPRPSRRA